MASPEEIADFIVRTVESSPNILGAVLGARIRQNFPGAWFGKLTWFINKYCKDTVVSTGRVGVDYTWATKPKIPLKENLVGGVEAASTGNRPPSETANLDSQISAWKAFVRSDTPSKLVVDAATNSLRVVPLNQTVPPPAVEIMGVTSDEYKKVAMEFTNQVEANDKAHFERLFQTTAFDPTAWYNYLSRWRTGYYLKQWSTFRFLMLCNIFTERLRAKGFQEMTIAACLENLRLNKGIKKPRFAITPIPSAHGVSDRRQHPPRTSLREVAVNIIQSLPEDDLRRLWLPLGAVIDATRKS